MKQCTTLRRSLSRACDLGTYVRWISSYDKGSLTLDALRQQVEAGLGKDAHGKPITIDPEAKTVSTDAGELPISPLFDPSWMKARRQSTKAEAGPPLGRFRRKLKGNPYANALATPMRRCNNSSTTLPRYFLQDFEMVKHPKTGVTWWAPGPLAFEHVQPNHDGPGKPEGQETDDHLQADETIEKVAAKGSNEGSKEPSGSSIVNPISRVRRGPVTVYTLGQKSMVDVIGGPNKKYLALLSAIRTGMAIASETKIAVWREDMGDLLLRMMRKRAVDALITRGNRIQDQQDIDRFIKPCASWDEVKEVKRRGCVLWLPAEDLKETSALAPFATLDVEGVSYGKKMAVHNLFWLLGDAEVQRLRSSASVFRDHEILVLKEWGSVSMMRLHLLLWRLQGYLGGGP